jgi:hypothetical protein
MSMTSYPYPCCRQRWTETWLGQRGAKAPSAKVGKRNVPHFSSPNELHGVHDSSGEDELLGGGDELVYSLEDESGLCRIVLASLETDPTENWPPAGV